MNALILGLAMFSQPMPERAWFKIEVETNTLVSISINGQMIEQDKVYKTQPLTKSVYIPVTARYVSGGEVKEQIFWLDLNPGDECIFKIQLFTIPPLVLAC